MAIFVQRQESTYQDRTALTNPFKLIEVHTEVFRVETCENYIVIVRRTLGVTHHLFTAGTHASTLLSATKPFLIDMNFVSKQPA